MKVKINGKDITFLDTIQVTRSLDSIASIFSLATRFNPDNDDHKELFKPLEYHKIEIFNSKGKVILTGTILNHSFQSDKDIHLVGLSGYSISGILEDVCMPTPYSKYPLESLNRSIKEIAESLCSAYGVGLIVDSSVSGLANQVLESSSASPSDSVKGYISKLTSQKNIVLSHDTKGNVVMFKPNDNAKVDYYFNSENSLAITSSFNGQGMHSQISCVSQPGDEFEGVSLEDKVINPLIKKFRPTTKVLSSGEETDNSKAANNELAAELKNIGVNVKVAALFDDIQPGDIVNVHNHFTYSFAYTRYMVSSVKFTETIDQATTELELVLPETYTGKVPKDILFFYKTHKTHI